MSFFLARPSNIIIDRDSCCKEQLDLVNSLETLEMVQTQDTCIS